MRGFRTILGGGLLTALLTLASATAWADDAAALAKILTGNYSSARQAAADPAQSAEVMRITPIWAGRTDGPWLYVERAEAAAPDTPTEQEIWQLKFQPHKGGTEVRFYTLPDPDMAVGAWRKPEKLRALLPEQLTRIEGCELVLQRRQEFEFDGGTPGMDCRPEDADAAYVLVQANVVSRGMRLWERGFDADGRQVSGPAEEGQRFDKVAIGDVSVDE